MKTFTAIALTVMLIMTVFTACAYENRFTLDADNLYPNTAIVIALDSYEDIVICIDGAGHEWIFEGVEDWMIGDLVSLLMFDNFTEIVTDDEIMVAWYGGHVGMSVVKQWIGE